MPPDLWHRKSKIQGDSGLFFFHWIRFEENQLKLDFLVLYAIRIVCNERIFSRPEFLAMEKSRTVSLLISSIFHSIIQMVRGPDILDET